jgi:hypothetical protein
VPGLLVVAGVFRGSESNPGASVKKCRADGGNESCENAQLRGVCDGHSRDI